MKYRMSLTYPDGNSVKGKTHHLQWYNKLGLNEFNLEGKRVLDIATDEGWWAFYSEMQGANYVEACDVEKGELYDWGAEKDKEWIEYINSTRTGKMVFDEHHKKLGSKVVYKKQSIYNITGEFDIVYAHGLLYHLRHPLLAIDKVSSVCNDIFCFETHVDLHTPETFAVSRFYRGEEYCRAISNWTGATVGCYASWLKDAGFKHIFRTTWGPYKTDRRIFIACKKDTYFNLFNKKADNVYLDDDFFKKVYNDTKYNFKNWSGKK